MSRLGLRWRPFAFALPRAMVTAHGALAAKRGWLLRLEGPDGALGWGEAAPLGHTPTDQEQQVCVAGIAALGASQERSALEALLPELPLPLAFALGSALAELDGWAGRDGGAGWLAPPPSAHLLPAGEALGPALEGLLAAIGDPPDPAQPLTVKWKVAAVDDAIERRGLELLLERLPSGARLRLDANGGWDRPTAGAWADRLAGDARLEWLEQPLDPADQEGLAELAERLPVALDESLRASAADLPHRWGGWQVRRPALEGDPRILWRQLRAGTPRLMVSTALETGIGQRLVGHLAALQARGPTPTAPGLAPGWSPGGPLFDADPQRVWEAAL